MISSSSATSTRVTAGIVSRFATRPSRVAIVVFLLVAVVALTGPLVAPHPPDALFGPPFSAPTPTYPLGLDYLGEDVLSRVLNGGATIFVIPTVATAIGYGLGLSVGLIAGLSRSLLDPILMRTMDILLAFPAFLLLLVLIAGLGTGIPSLVVAVALLQLPFVARTIRSASLEISVSGYVEAAIARGEPLLRIARREVLPGLKGVIVATVGPAFTTAILAVAGLSYLGLGLKAPQADWALMLSENRNGMILQPLSVIVPALLIAALTVSINVAGDGLAQSFGRSAQVEEG